MNNNDVSILKHDEHLYYIKNIIDNFDITIDGMQKHFLDVSIVYPKYLLIARVYKKIKKYYYDDVYYIKNKQKVYLNYSHEYIYFHLDTSYNYNIYLLFPYPYVIL